MTEATVSTNPGTVERGYRRAAPPSHDQTTTTTRRAVIYLRVSTAEQASKGDDAEGYSIPAQREACYRKAKELGADVVDQYVDRGETAKVADRPALNLMLQRITELADIDLVIVHKLDRLARNRMDDANLTFAIAQHGARLVSCSEHIDDTPAGKLTHGILAVINQYQSDNLATESTKGMLKKAQLGGTPGKAPIGYLNVKQRINGDEVATVVVDSERADDVRWAFNLFARGEHSLADLTVDLEDRGLKTPSTKKRVGGPLSKSMVARMLRDRYYIGVVTYKGIEYAGNHPPLVDSETFWAVQDILDDRNGARLKQRKHRHYLRGTIFCGRCRRQLIFSQNQGQRGGTYGYFFCTGRRDGCTLPYLPVEIMEDEIANFWRRSVAMPATVAEQIQQHLQDRRKPNEMISITRCASTVKRWRGHRRRGTASSMPT